MSRVGRGRDLGRAKVNQAKVRTGLAVKGPRLTVEVRGGSAMGGSDDDTDKVVSTDSRQGAFQALYESRIPPEANASVNTLRPGRIYAQNVGFGTTRKVPAHDHDYARSEWAY